MLKFIIGLVFSHISLTLLAQNQIKKYVQESSFSISSIQPTISDYTDLEALGNAIGDAKIVMLGEQDHGDAPAFLAKTRLIKYLHEKKGFNVLAFESDFFGLNYNWELVRNGKLSTESFIERYINPLWVLCTAGNSLFYQYLPAALKTNNPLQVTGFDNIMNTRVLLPVLDSVLQSLQLPITALPEYRSQIFPLVTLWYNNTRDTITNKKVTNYLMEIKEQMLEKLPKDDFWVVTVDNLIQLNIQFNNWKKDYWKDMNTRDRQMAANLRWLNNIKYPNEKIIVWAHNYHVSKYAGNYPEVFLNKANTMGSVLTEDTSLMQKTYIIGFTSYEGTAGRLFGKTYKVQKPKGNSFENWINKTSDYAFVDFTKYNITNPNDQAPFYLSGATKGNRYHNSQLAQWNKIFDGVFFIRKMYSCLDEATQHQAK